MSAFTQFLDSVLGSYSPITYDAGSDVLIPDGFAGVDWPYLIRAAAFLLVVWCVLRIVGGLICR